MPRKREGSLVYRRNSGYNAFVWVTVKSEDGTTKDERRWIPLKTHDKDLAKRKLAKIVAGVASGEIVAEEVQQEAKRTESVRELKEAFIEHRKATKVVQAPDEEHWLDEHVLPAIGELPISRVRTRDIDLILEKAAATYSRESVTKLRGATLRMFHRAWKAGTITENPVVRSTIPETARVDERPRVVLTDEQIRIFLSGRASGPNGKKPRKDSEHRLLELKVMACCARILGGLRTAEVNRWSWDLLVDPDVAADEQSFASVKVRRAKAKRGKQPKVQSFVVPEPMRPILIDWHKRHGFPTDGAVFPVTKGKNAGKHRKERGTSYAARLRRELFRMGIKDHVIHHDTATSKRVDFHSFRRAFVTGTAADGAVSMQEAMRLSAHSDPRVHLGYIDKHRPLVIPASTIPALPPSLGSAAAAAERGPGLAETSIFRHARYDSNIRHPASKAGDGEAEGYIVIEEVPRSWVERAADAFRCFPVFVGEKKQGCCHSETPSAAPSGQDEVWN